MKLTQKDRDKLERVTKRGKNGDRKITRARISLKADEEEFCDAWIDEKINQAFDEIVNTMVPLHNKFVTQGLEATLNRKRYHLKKSKRKLDGERDVKLIGITCGNPSEGHERQTLRLLACRLIELGIIYHITHETVRQTLKNDFKP